MIPPRACFDRAVDSVQLRAEHPLGGAAEGCSRSADRHCASTALRTQRLRRLETDGLLPELRSLLVLGGGGERRGGLPPPPQQVCVFEMSVVASVEITDHRSFVTSLPTSPRIGVEE